MLQGFEKRIIIKAAGGKLSPGIVKIREGVNSLDIITDKDYGIGIMISSE